MTIVLTKEELYKRFQGKSCKRMPKDSSAKELKEVHRIKMEMKEYMRQRIPQSPKPHILANISVHHENYGETPQENMKRMTEKNS